MRPRKEPESNVVFELPGGNEDNTLFATRMESPDGMDLIVSSWEPNILEAAALAEGGRVELVVFGEEHPPVAMTVTLRDKDGNLCYITPDAKAMVVVEGQAVPVPAALAAKLRAWLEVLGVMLARQIRDHMSGNKVMGKEEEDLTRLQLREITDLMEVLPDGKDQTPDRPTESPGEDRAA